MFKVKLSSVEIVENYTSMKSIPKQMANDGNKQLIYIYVEFAETSAQLIEGMQVVM